jgi:hypothetical protein
VQKQSIDSCFPVTRLHFFRMPPRLSQLGKLVMFPTQLLGRRDIAKVSVSVLIKAATTANNCIQRSISITLRITLVLHQMPSSELPYMSIVGWGRELRLSNG